MADTCHPKRAKRRRLLEKEEKMNKLICENCALFDVGDVCVLLHKRDKKPLNNECDEFVTPEAFNDFCDCRPERNLDLVLKAEWYDKISSGAKTSEYREIKPYWQKRFSQWDYKYTTVTFRRGYTNISMQFNIISISKTKEPNDLGLPECYEIKLGKRIK